jgi:hypothetical protein
MKYRQVVHLTHGSTRLVWTCTCRMTFDCGDVCTVLFIIHRASSQTQPMVHFSLHIATEIGGELLKWSLLVSIEGVATGSHSCNIVSRLSQDIMKEKEKITTKPRVTLWLENVI